MRTTLPKFLDTVEILWKVVVWASLVSFLAIRLLAQPQPPPAPPLTNLVWESVSANTAPAVYDPKAQLARNQAIAPTKFPVLPVPMRTDLPMELAVLPGELVTWEIGASPSASTNAGLGYLLHYWQVTVPATSVYSVPATVVASNIVASVMLPGPGRWFWGATAVDNSSSVESAMVTYSNRYPFEYTGELVTFGSEVIGGFRFPFMTNQVTLDSPVNFLWQELRKVIIP